MNCKQGDMAVVIKGANAGLIVDVLLLAPVGVGFVLPNGVRARALDGPGWIICSNGSPFKGKARNGVRSLSQYAAMHDTSLRPVSGIPDFSTTTNEALA